MDFPSTLLTQEVPEDRVLKVLRCPPPPIIYPNNDLVVRAAELLTTAKRPLIIIGKGKHGTCQYIFMVKIK